MASAHFGGAGSHTWTGLSRCRFFSRLDIDGVNFRVDGWRGDGWREHEGLRYHQGEPAHADLSLAVGRGQGLGGRQGPRVVADGTGGQGRHRGVGGGRSVARHVRHAARARRRTVLCLRVTPKVHFALKRSSTAATGEGLEARVLAAVGDEVGGLRESLATLSAHIRLFTWNVAGVRRHEVKFFGVFSALACGQIARCMDSFSVAGSVGVETEGFHKHDENRKKYRRKHEKEQ